MASISMNENGQAVFTVGQFTVTATARESGVDLAISGEGNGRFQELNDGGGHLELRKPGSLTTGIGLELDEAGRAVFHDA
jgi:hypothetical protein